MKNGMHFEGSVWGLVRACKSENDPLLPDKLYFLILKKQVRICSILINGRE
jgi:hypothetical protein